MKGPIRSILLTAIALVVAAPAWAAPLHYEEGTLGDLSGNTASPTALAFDVGENLVSGQMGRPPVGSFDIDTFTFTVQPGHTLSRIELLEFAPSGDFGTGSFAAIAAGTSIDHFDATMHLGDALLSSTGDILPLLAAGTIYGAPGFEASLGSGTYTFWFEEASTQVGYALSFHIVPEPGTGVLAAVGLALLGSSGRRAHARGGARSAPLRRHP